ncbi:hypothetical protein TorRG33x02_232960 [Trema orientale]|uniref:Uncharacterized protein n=1 Tax=Trema orientale TaxID=63057 RepID=A0A2P5E5S9_TREOI|nr:hypothetical protein TorRG33x02_232960 [Trema orientale]
MGRSSLYTICRLGWVMILWPAGRSGPPEFIGWAGPRLGQLRTGQNRPAHGELAYDGLLWASPWARPSWPVGWTILACGLAYPGLRAGLAQPTYRIAHELGWATLFLRWAGPV